MSSHFRASLSLLVALGCICSPLPVATQQESVGRIERITELLGEGSVREIRQPTEKVQIRRRGSADWANAAPRVALSIEEMLRVERFVDARLPVDRPGQTGVLTFLPELLRPDGGEVFPAAVVGQQLEEGLYGVGGEGGGADELTVAIERGALVVNWSRGRLAVLAAGTRTLVMGTRLALAVDPEGEQGLLYLETGAVSFPDFPEVRVSPGDFIHLQRGLPPTLWPPGRIQPATAEEAIRFHDEQIWERATPFWRRPVFLVPAAIVVGAVIWAATRDEGYEPPR